MNLGEYIDYYGSLSYEELFAKYREHSDPNVASYVSLEKVNLPEQLISEMCTREPERQPEHLGVKSQYRVKYDDELQTWAEQAFPHLQFVDVRMQSQPPGEKVPAHLDLLPVYLKKVCNKVPYLRKIKHSIEDPGLDVHQLIIACEDQVEALTRDESRLYQAHHSSRKQQGCKLVGPYARGPAHLAGHIKHGGDPKR